MFPSQYFTLYSCIYYIIDKLIVNEKFVHEWRGVAGYQLKLTNTAENYRKKWNVSAKCTMFSVAS